MKITIQVMVPPYTYEDLDTALKIAEAAVEKGHEVNLFLFADSVLCINKNIKPLRIDRNIPNKIKEMISAGKIKVDILRYMHGLQGHHHRHDRGRRQTQRIT
jgi:Uncharacterized conserved protein involved in intracellular sulfur reduction